MTEALTWDSHSWLVPLVKSALSMGMPPLAVLAEDPKRKKYTRWDIRLVRAYHDREHWDVNGYPIWVEESKDVEFKAKKKVIRSKAVVEAAEKAYQKSLHPEKGPAKPGTPGLTFYPTMKVKEGKSYPRFEDWVKTRNGQAAPDPTEDKLAQRRIRAEERAARKVSELGRSQ